VLMDGVTIGRDARVTRTIIDKGVQIPAGLVVGEDPDDDARRYLVSPDGVVVIAKGMAL
jgi:glucose-1-phosphate adenylyltransferase